MEKQSQKTINYFLVKVNIIKNGQHEIIEEHGIKGLQSISEHGHNKLKDTIKSMRKQNYLNDSMSVPVIISSTPITKEQYESLPFYARH